MNSRIDRLARRVEDDEYFLASALGTFARSENMDETGLASLLGCTVGAMSALRLCRRPHPDPARFREDIDRIAARFNVNADKLAEVVRRSDALLAMRRWADTATSGLMMAARDRLESDGKAEVPGETPS